MPTERISMGKSLFESITKKETEIEKKAQQQPQEPNADTIAPAPAPAPENVPIIPENAQPVPYEPNFNNDSTINDVDLLSVLENTEDHTSQLIQPLNNTTNNSIVNHNSPRASGILTGCHIRNVHIHLNKN